MPDSVNNYICDENYCLPTESFLLAPLYTKIIIMEIIMQSWALHIDYQIYMNTHTVFYVYKNIIKVL